jgi:hypothetical protein
LLVSQNSPNPFHGTTTIAYRLIEPGPATLCLYDLRGHCLRTLVDPGADKGVNRFDLDARDLPSGVYLYSIEADHRREWKRCIVVR